MSNEERAATATPEQDTSADADTESEKDTDERARVLRMVAEGRITVDEAVELLKALGPDVEEEEHTHSHGPWQWRFGPGAYVGPGPGPFGPFGQHFGPPVLKQAIKHMKRGAKGRPGVQRRGADVVFNVGAPGPIPPVPPIPGVSPIPPVPPLPGMTNRVLVFDIEYEGNTYTARLPIGLVGDANRFLPRQARQVLDEFEIDVEQIVQLVNNIDPEHGGPLIDIEHERNHVKVRIE